MKKIFTILCVSALAVGISFAEGQKDKKESKKLNIAFISKSYANPFFEYMRIGVLDLAKKDGFNITYFAPTKPYNLEEQTRLVDDAIAKRVDGIVLVPVDSKGMVPAVERVNAAKIPVSIVNTKLYGGKIVSFAAIENYGAMVRITEYMMKKLKGKGKIIILEGTPGNQTAIDRLKAQKDVIAKYKDIELLASQAADFDRAKGMAVMENLIQSYPKIDAILSGNCEMSLGAIEALRAAGRLKNVLISGFDVTSDTIKAIKDGEMLITMDQSPDQQAIQATKELIKAIKGQPVEAEKKISGVIIDSSNVKNYEYMLSDKK